jgi:hypothetical protein
MECSRELFLIMYFVILVLCECGEELNNSIVSFCVHALFHEWLPLLELEQKGDCVVFHVFNGKQSSSHRATMTLMIFTVDMSFDFDFCNYLKLSKEQDLFMF